MAVGSSGLGKTSFINTLCQKPVLPPKDYSGISRPMENQPAETLDIKSFNVDIEEDGMRVSLSIIDTPGFGESIDNQKCFDKILNYVEMQYDNILAEETRIKRNPRFQDNRIHALLYFITPTGHGLRELDIELMKKLGPRVNIIPIIGKADSFTVEELKAFKSRIMEDIDHYRIPIYNFPYDPVEDDEETIEQNEELKSMLPFAVISHEQEITEKREVLRVRKYPWGIIDVDSADVCDTASLRFMLFNSHMTDLKLLTHDHLYENYRTEKLSRTGEYDDFESYGGEDQIRAEQEKMRQEKEKLLHERQQLEREREEQKRMNREKEEMYRALERQNSTN
ncbi:Cell division control protein 11 [Entomophthora muscae]|uniref:Cell division control protein 11 n=3 Tax=Entomophthora muscae TaxID=34485 RepID=A0ACC2UEE7_9FUNG|nr:Cell division control protein 11 [Entomophthora muscae]KAJ9090500.1 Cell division control protein 11 [Entomophthora muscae]